MIIKLEKETDVFSYEEALNIHGKPLSTVIATLANTYDHEPSVEIQIHPSLLSQGYRVNPSMFGQHVRAKVNNYLYTRCVQRNRYVVILCTNDSTPMAFTERIRQCVRDGVIIEVPIDEIPETYKHQLHLLRHRIKKDTGFKLKIRKLKTKHVYSRA